MRTNPKHQETLVVSSDPGLTYLGLGAIRETGKEVAHLGNTPPGKPQVPGS